MASKRPTKKRKKRPKVLGRREMRQYRYYVHQSGYPFSCYVHGTLRSLWLRIDAKTGAQRLVDASNRLVIQDLSAAYPPVSQLFDRKEVHWAGIYGDAIIPKAYWVAEGL